jgi:hypothetical protein
LDARVLRARPVHSVEDDLVAVAIDDLVAGDRQPRIAFSFSFVLINVSYAIPVLSDPFGWGWNLFGTAGYRWTPYFPELLPYLQVPVLALGLMFSIRLGQFIALENYGNAAEARRAALPVSVFLTAVTLALVWLYIG